MLTTAWWEDDLGLMRVLSRVDFDAVMGSAPAESIEKNRMDLNATSSPVSKSTGAGRVMVVGRPGLMQGFRDPL